MRRGQRTFRLNNEQERHACYYIAECLFCLVISRQMAFLMAEKGTDSCDIAL